MTTISPVSLPSLYTLPTRTLPEEAIVHQPVVRYTHAQMEMRPVERADAALMAVIEPGTFPGFIEAVKTDGDWRSILEGFSQKLASHPEWLTNEAYRKAAAEILRRTNYFMDLSGLGLR